MCVSSAASVQSENRKNTTATDKNTVSLSLSDESEVSVMINLPKIFFQSKFIVELRCFLSSFVVRSEL